MNIILYTTLHKVLTTLMVATIHAKLQIPEWMPTNSSFILPKHEILLQKISHLLLVKTDYFCFNCFAFA